MLKNLFFNIRQSYWVKSATVVVSTRLLLTALGFTSFLFLIRFLDKDQYGLWVIFMTITSLIETVRVGFIKNPLMILHSNSSYNKNGLYNSSFHLNIGLSILIIIIILIVTPFFASVFDHDIIKSLLYLYIIKLIIISIGDHFDIVQEANLEFKGTFLDLFFRNLTFVIGIIICYYFNIQLPLYYLVFFQIVGALFGLFFSFLNSRKKQIFAFSFLQYNIIYIRKLMSLGKYTFGSSASSIAMRNIDTWMLGSFLSSSSVALYNPALRISNIFEIPTSTLSTILLPKLINEVSVSGERAIKYYYEKAMSYVLIFMIPIIVIGVLFSDEIILIIAGAGFEQSSYFLNFTMFYGLLIPFNRQFSITLDALGKTKLNFTIVCLSLLVSVILNIIFIAQFGIIGAIYGTLITYLIVFIFSQFYLYYKFQISLIGIFLNIIPSCKLILSKLKKLVRNSDSVS